MIRLCLCCKRDISHKAIQAIYCSIRCKEYMYRENQNKNCLECGKDIFLTRKEKFCSRYCTRVYDSKVKNKKVMAELMRRYSDRMYMMSLNSSKQAMTDIKRLTRRTYPTKPNQYV